TKLAGDNSTLGTVTDALSIGSSVVSTATNGINQAISIVQQIRNKLTSALQPSVDVNTVQKDIAQLQQQLGTIASSSSINGINLLDQVGTTAGTNYTVGIVASFQRNAQGVASVGTISLSSLNTSLFNSTATTL